MMIGLCFLTMGEWCDEPACSCGPVASWGTIGAQADVGIPLVPADLGGLAAYPCVLVTLTALGMQGA